MAKQFGNLLKRTQRILGNLIKEAQERGELKQGGRGSNQYAKVPDRNLCSTPTLADVGISKKQSHVFQKIADMPEEIFDVIVRYLFLEIVRPAQTLWKPTQI